MTEERAALGCKVGGATGADSGAAEPFLAAVGLIAALRAGYESAEQRAAATDLLEAGLGGYAVKEEQS